MQQKVVGWYWLPLVVCVIYPLSNLILVSLQFDGAHALLSLTAYFQIVKDPILATVLYNTLYVSLLSTLAAVLLGAAAAVITEKTDLPILPIWRLLFLLPLLLPSYVISLAWGHWLGPVGIFTRWFESCFGIVPWNITGLSGITVVMTIAHIPIAYLLVRSALLAIPGQLEEAARVAGARPSTVFLQVILPLLVPAIASGLLLSLASAVDNFGIPAFIGIPSGVTVLSTLIYQKVIGLGASQFEQAAALSVLTGIFVMVPVYLQGRLFQRPKYLREEWGNGGKPYQMGWFKWPFLIILSLWHLITIVGPFVSMLIISFAPAYGVDVTLANSTLDHYRTLFMDMPAVLPGLLNSLLLATLATSIILVISWPLARAMFFSPSRMTKLLDAIGTVPYCIPGMVLALAVLFTWLNPMPGSSFSLYGGMLILLLAYVPRFFTFGVRTWATAWPRLSPSLEEAGRIAGAGAMKVVWRIVLPNFKEEAVGGGLLIFLLAFTELTMSALLVGSRHPTLGVLLFNMESAGQTLESAALGTLLTLFTILLSVVVSQYLPRKGNG